MSAMSTTNMQAPAGVTVVEFPDGTSASADTNGIVAVPNQWIAFCICAGLQYAVNVGGVLDKGAKDCSTNPNYPSGVVGDQYHVSVAGKIGGASGLPCGPGDVIQCIVANAGGTQASVGADWVLVPGNKAILKRRIVGKLIGANMNSTADQAIAIDCAKYIVRGIIGTNASISLDTAVGGVYPTTSKGGTAIVANSQVYSALTAASKFVDLTVASQTDVLTAANLYLSLTTAQGAAVTADLYVIADVLA